MEGFLEEPTVRAKEKKTCWQNFKEEVKELRWRILIFVCFLTFGSYYVYDFPGSLGNGKTASIEERFAKHGKVFTQEMNQLLYSVYSWPNTCLAIFGGILIDKYLGIRFSLLLFTFLILLGSFLFWLGVYCVQYPLMVTARVIFGIGGESLSAAQSAYVARWFKGSRGMAFAFGITLSFSRIGSSFNFLFSTKIAETNGVDIAVLVGVFACLISLISCIILALADVYAVRIGYVNPEPHLEQSTVMRFSDVLKLPLAYWILVIICVFCYGAIFPFIGISTNYFEVKYNYTRSEASSYASAYQFSSAAGSPVIGLLVDNVGYETLWLIFSSAFFVLTHLLISYTPIPGLAVMIIFGIVYSFLVSSLWPLVPWVVNENVLGVSYGVMTALQNLGMAIFPIIVGAILDNYTPAKKSTTNDLKKLSNAVEEIFLPTLEGYIMTELLFIVVAFISLVASVVLLIIDLRNGKIITALGNKRRDIDKKVISEPGSFCNDEKNVSLKYRE